MRLGSHEGAYATALFLLRGGVVPQDEKEAVSRLRTAADAGNLPAKVYLANMYEAGVYFRADAEKADVWHRSIARSAGVTAAVGSAAYIRAMADQGVGRYAALLAREVPTAEGDALLKRAAAFGWRTPQRATPVVIDPVPPPVSSRAAPTRSRPRRSPHLARRAASSPRRRGRRRNRRRTCASRMPMRGSRRGPRARRGTIADRSLRPSAQLSRRGIDWGGGILRFVFLAMFAAAGLAAAHMARQGAALLVTQGRPVPLVGTHLEWILPGVLGVLVLLPALALYRLPAVMKSLVLAALTGVGGVLAWGHGRATLTVDPPTQGIVFALAGFVVGLLVFGFTRKRPPVRKALTHTREDDGG